jgi:hypothetical protein
MAEDKIEGRERTWQGMLPWTVLFRGFHLALDLNKLLLAAAGILVMWLGWLLLATIFGLGYGFQPEWTSYAKKYPESPDRDYANFWRARQEWNLMYEAAGAGGLASGERQKLKWEVPDVAASLKDYQTVSAALIPTTANDPDAHFVLNEKALQAAKAAGASDTAIAAVRTKKVPQNESEKELPAIKDQEFSSREDLRKALAARLPDTEKASVDKLLDNAFVGRHILNKADYDAWLATLKPDDGAAHFKEVAPLYNKLGQPKFVAGRLSTDPWDEDRGPNPFLLVSGQSGAHWEAGHFWEWFSRDLAPVMVEPLIKLFRPIIYFFDSRGNAYTSLYFILVLLWAMITWAFFGGAITRIAAVQAARGEKIGAFEAMRFVRKRWASYVMAPIFPLILMLILTVFMILFGVLVMIPFIGDVIAGVFWVILLVLGLIMAVVLVGLISWPLMSATISTEGEDSWAAVSRSYTYVLQKPWHYIWYTMVAICYGAILVFFVGFMGSLTAYLSKWGVSQTPGISWVGREPSYLFAYAPRSFGWRDLLLQGARTPPNATPPDTEVVQGGKINPEAYNAYVSSSERYWWYNTAAAGLMAVWLGLLFLLVLGFGYSYFWVAGTLIYLLMRNAVDETYLDEVYLEEEEQEGGHPLPTPPPGAIKPGPPVTMVESPALRSGPAPAATAGPAPMATPAPTTVATTTPTPLPSATPAAEPHPGPVDRSASAGSPAPGEPPLPGPEGGPGQQP